MQGNPTVPFNLQFLTLVIPVTRSWAVVAAYDEVPTVGGTTGGLTVGGTTEGTTVGGTTGGPIVGGTTGGTNCRGTTGEGPTVRVPLEKDQL